MKLLVVGAHADDTVLNAGGTMAKFIRRGDQVRDVTFSIHRGVDVNFKPEIKNEHEAATGIFAGREAWEVQQKNNNFSYRLGDFRACGDAFEWGESRSDIRRILEEERELFQPDLVISHSRLDSNQDHAALASEVRRVFKKKSTIYEFVFPWNHTGLWPNVFVEVSTIDMETKLQALECYASQRRPGHDYMSRAVQLAWAKSWGSINSWEAAEAFILQQGFF